MTPKFGDRISIKNVPEEYSYKEMYSPVHVISGINDNNVVGMAWGYLPFLNEKGHRELSGTYHSVPVDAVTFVKSGVAKFWRFKDGEVKAHNGENYELPVNFFECNFDQLV